MQYGPDHHKWPKILRSIFFCVTAQGVVDNFLALARAAVLSPTTLVALQPNIYTSLRHSLFVCNVTHQQMVVHSCRSPMTFWRLFGVFGIDSGFPGGLLEAQVGILSTKLSLSCLS